MIKRFICPGCGQKLTFHSRSPRVRCPQCRQVTEIHPASPGQENVVEEGTLIHSRN